MDSQGFALGVVVVVNNSTQVSAFMLSNYLKIQTPRVYSETAHRKKFQVAGRGGVWWGDHGNHKCSHQNQAVQHNPTVVGSPEATPLPLPLTLTFGTRDQ